MNSKRSRRRATYEDLLKVPDHLVAEIVDGDLYTSPRPRIGHARAGVGLLQVLAPFTAGGNGSGGWWIVYEPELHFDEDVVVPDIVGWRVERMPVLPSDAPFSTLAPDWLCEISSPSTARFDRTKKLPVYARVGVRHVWFVDPMKKTFEVLTLDGGTWKSDTADESVDSVRAAPFDAIEIPMAFIWGDGSAATTPH